MAVQRLPGVEEDAGIMLALIKGRDRTLDVEQAENGGLRRAHGIFDGKDNVVGNSQNWLMKARLRDPFGMTFGRSVLTRGMNWAVM
ncbi:hypothetical protein ACQPTN_06300 [Bradyrhizobium sp. 13971]